MSDLANKYASIIADDLFRLNNEEHVDKLLFRVRGTVSDHGWSKTAVQYRLREHLRRMLSDHDKEYWKMLPGFEE